MKIMRLKRAFTLFEVLIALAILAISMVAAMMTTDNVLIKTIDIEKKVIAHWVGVNVLNSMELKLLKDKIDVSQTSGQSMLKGQVYNYDLKISKIKIKDINLLNMRVIVSNVSDTSNKSNMSQQLEILERNVPIV